MSCTEEGDSHGRAGEAGGTVTPAKIIRASGASNKVMIAHLPDGSLRIEGAEGLAQGETALVLYPNHKVAEILVRWTSGEQAGAVIVE